MFENFDSFMIICLGGPLDGCAVESSQLPEVDAAVMEFSAKCVNDGLTVHVYKCRMHPSRVGLRAYIYEGARKKR
jgi:hypothetical protein